MIKAERQDKVRQLLEEQGTVSVKEISDALGVSDMTIRRDLEELASLGEIERVHGGARSAQGRPHAMLRHEYSHSEKRTKHAEEKLQIARRAVELIEEGSTIFLGTGTTVEQMASMLPAFRLRIVTNSLSVFNLLEAREDCDLCLVGGMYRRRTAAFVGPTAEDTLRALGIDAAFIGANGILDGDVSTSNMDEGRIQQLAFSKADSRYLIADSSKIGKRDFYTFCRLDSLDAVVCEPGIAAEDRAAIEEHTQVICELTLQAILLPLSTRGLSLHVDTQMCSGQVFSLWVRPGGRSPVTYERRGRYRSFRAQTCKDTRSC